MTTDYRNLCSAIGANPQISQLREYSGALIISIIILASLMAPLLTSYDPVTSNLAQIYEAPSWEHPCGTDQLGRDVFSRLLYGTRVSLSIGVSAALLAVFIGVVIGLLAGYYRGIIDSILMRSVDCLASVPEMIAILYIMTIFPRSVIMILLAIALTHWMSTARLVRSEALSLRQRPFIEASIGLGAGDLYVLFRHMFPNILFIAIVSTTLMTTHAIMHEASLGFLGLGIPVHLASWGNMLTESRTDILLGVWWTTFFPGIIIVVAMMSVYHISTVLTEKFVPRRELKAE